MLLPKLSALVLVTTPIASHANGERLSAALRGSNNQHNPPDDLKNGPLLKLYRNKKDALIATWGASSASAASIDDSVVTVDKNDWVQQCAATFQEHYDPKTYTSEYSNFYFIAEPAGLCAGHLSCAFDNCYGSVSGGIDDDSMACLLNQTDLSTVDYDDVAATCNFPKSALPESITFPKTAADVVMAIKYATENDMQVSIKSTGHSETGSSTKAGTLMINMRDYVKHAAGDDSVVECDSSSSSGEVGDPCILAKARGKDAYIRVGGGQTWSDVYNAVNASNTVGNLSKNYGVGGGAAGSVGSAGGWLSGGGLSIGYERTEGLGVDQILELELALPDGSHVRVFPTEWDEVEEKVYPQTSKVQMLCNRNVVAAESLWDWQPCTLRVAAEDLWLAVRGGGGGTYAVTLSVKYQLFEQHPLRSIVGGALLLETSAKEVHDTLKAKFEAKPALWDEFRRTYTLFLVDFLFAPEKIGVSNEASLRCGNSGTNFQTTSALGLFCWGPSLIWLEFSAAWNQAVYGTKLAEEDPELAELLSKYFFADMESFGQGPFSSWGDVQRTLFTNPNNDEIYPQGVVPDSPLPQPVPDRTIGTACSANFPLGLLQSDDEDERELVFKILDLAGGEHTTGGNLAQASDGMTAVSPTERISGQSSMGLEPAIEIYGDGILSDFLAAVYKYAADADGAFPGFYEYNHMCSDAKTTSKADWTKVCSEEDGEDCFSIQETVWGETMYDKLQGIKSVVDPDNLFDCYLCVKPLPSKSTVVSTAL